MATAPVTEDTASTSPLSRNDYCIGIIAPMPVERAAIFTMLDTRYDQPADFEYSAQDVNKYTYGRLKSHNVVITSFPAGLTGTTITTSTANTMAYAFPNLKFGLIVGIAAGVPGTSDVRLGDVVVGQPSGTCGGVFQYDLGKLKHGEWQRKDFLARPPEALLTALSELQTEHILGFSKVHDHFRNAMNRNETWRAFFKRPGVQDRLFHPSHPHKESGDSECTECDPAGVLERLPREPTSTFEIHYGTIASGNTMVKDVALRDKIASMDKKCICIEMEAAGVMNNLRCLVIRGISDYADSHTNKTWQPYAAAMAAAFAKELLGFLPVAATKTASRVSELTDANMNVKSVYQVKIADDKKLRQFAYRDAKFKMSPQDDPLYASAREGCREVFEALLESGADIEQRSGEDQWTMLHRAADEGELKVAQILLEYGASVNVRTASGVTPLHLAAYQNNVKIAELLLREGAQLESREGLDRKPLHLAAFSGAEEMTSFLLDKRAEVDPRDSMYDRPLDIAAQTGQFEVVRRLHQGGADLESRHHRDNSILHIAADSGSTDMVSLLVDLKADVAARNGEKRTPLQVAIRKGHLEVAEVLLHSGAELDVRDIWGRTSLHEVAELGVTEAVSLLLDLKADINARDRFKQTPLHLAVENNHLEVAALLCRGGADLELKDAFGFNPLHQAARYGSAQMISLLLDLKANVSAKDAWYNKLVSVTIEREEVAITRLFLARGADANAKDHHGETLLHQAARSGYLEIVKLLLEYGASEDAVDDSKLRPIDLARNYGHETIVSVLAEHGRATPVDPMDGRQGRSTSCISPKPTKLYERDNSIRSKQGRRERKRSKKS